MSDVSHTSLPRLRHWEQFPILEYIENRTARSLRSQIAATGEDGLQWISDVVFLNTENACRLPSFQTGRGQKVPAAYKEIATGFAMNGPLQTSLQTFANKPSLIFYKFTTHNHNPTTVIEQKQNPAE